MKTHVYDQNNKTVSEVNILSDVAIHSNGISQAINYLKASSYISVAHTKDRGEVSGSNIKPWRQKGTGNARAGSKRSPLWRGGGVTFGPLSTDNNFKRIPKKMLVLAKQSVLLQKIESGQAKVINNLALPAISTNKASNLINGFGFSGRTLIIAEKTRENDLSFRNIGGVTLKSNDANALDLASFNNIIITIDQLKNTFSENKIETTEKSVAKTSTAKKA